MTITGLIVEYNPFHNGHAYHVESAKNKTDSDLIIAVMSGHFLQRGEPAILPKWWRTKMALNSGIDLVVELPYAYATQKAETFATGAVSILHNLGATDLVFGSEAGEIDAFHQLIHLEEKNTELYHQHVHHLMKKGLSYPKALAHSYTLLGEPLPIDVHQPNNILGLHYVKAIHRFNSSIKANTIQRILSHYHDEELNETSIASATGIRKTLIEHNFDFTSIRHVMPSYSLEIIENYWDTYNLLHTWENYFPLLKHKLLLLSAEELESFYEIEEGIQHRLKKYILQASTFKEFMTLIKTKRYTWTRLQRMCLHILTGAKKSDFHPIKNEDHVPYIRLLGMNEKGRKHLHSIKKNCPIPIVSVNKDLTHPLAKLDQQATFTYAFPIQTALQNDYIKNDLFHPPVFK